MKLTILKSILKKSYATADGHTDVFASQCWRAAITSLGTTGIEPFTKYYTFTKYIKLLQASRKYFQGNQMDTGNGLIN